MVMAVELTDDIRNAVKGMLTAAPKPKIPTRQYIGERSTRASKNPWAGGFKSDALGVSPDQIPEAREKLAKAGVNVDFDRRTGAAIVESERHYQQIAKASGLKTGRDGYDNIKSGRDAVRGREAMMRSLLG